MGIVCALLLVVIVVSIATSGTKVRRSTVRIDGATTELVLQSAQDEGPDPFTDSVAVPAPASTVPASAPVTLGAGSPPPTAPVFPSTASGLGQVSTVFGGTPGLYGGVRGRPSCDGPHFVDLLAAHPGRAQAWADAQGIGRADLSSFVGGLTPVVLRGDTRVTDHGYRDGGLMARQAVLETGTAVFVDRYGVPRVRCASGSPLLPPIPFASASSYQGQPWPTFDPAAVVLVSRNPTAVGVLTLVDVTDGQPFGRPPGSVGHDEAPPPTTTPIPAPTVVIPGTIPVGGSSGPAGPGPTYHLVSATHTVGEQASSWTVDDQSGTATFDLGAKGRATYHWSVPGQIGPDGTTLAWGGTASPTGSGIEVAIVPGADGLTFSTTDLAVDETGGRGERTAAVALVPAADSVTLSYRIGSSVVALYTYRR